MGRAGTAGLVLILIAMLAVAPRALAADRETVSFQINQTTVFGQSIFVLGDLPELGGNDIRFAVKLEPSAYPNWRAPISLPAGRSFTYRYYIRNDAAGQWGNSGNGTALGAGPIQGMTASEAFTPSSKTVFYHSGFSPPVFWWREGSSGPFQSITMHDAGPGRNPAEKRWAARRFGAPRRTIEFHFTNQAQALRDPAGGEYSTALDALLLQDGNVFTYIPAPAVAGPMKNYTFSGGPPTTSSTSRFSTAMNETRYYRVIVPRGYDQHPGRSYPVLYFHDGQNMFEQGAFGTWNADETAESMIRLGQMREVIMVGMDHGPNRINDYAAPDSGGWADGRYLQFVLNEMMPLINSQYRTLTGPSNTGIAGSSMGGQASMWFGWDEPGVFGRIGAFSGAWSVFNSGFYNRVQSQPRRDIRIYLDSGDSGGSNDGFWNTVGLRDNLINPGRASGVGGPYVLEGDLRHIYGPGHLHNEAAWAARLPRCLEFLFPASEAPDELADVPSSSRADVDDNDLEDIEDLYAFEQGAPGPDSTLDVDRNGVVEPDIDRAALRSALRAGEAEDIATF